MDVGGRGWDKRRKIYFVEWLWLFINKFGYCFWSVFIGEKKVGYILRLDFICVLRRFWGELFLIDWFGGEDDFYWLFLKDMCYFSIKLRFFRVVLGIKKLYVF